MIDKTFYFLILISFVTAIARTLQQQNDGIPPIKISYRGLQKPSSIFPQDSSDVEVQVSLKGGSSSFRIPVALTLIVDGSESQIEDDADDRIQESLNYIAQNLVQYDFIGLTVYDYQGRNELSLSRVGLGNIVDNFTSAVATYNPVGGTNLFQGLDLGLKQQIELDVTGQIIQAFVLFTDGFTNIGIVEDQKILSLVQEVINAQNDVRAIATYVIAAGMESADFLLEDIADVNNGGFYTVSNTQEILKAYGLFFGGLITTYYNNIEVDLEPSPGVEVQEVRSGSLKKQGKKLSFTDLISEERRDIVYSFKVQPDQIKNNTDNFNVAKVSVSYINNGKLTGAKSQQTFDLNVSTQAQSRDFKDPVVQIQKSQQNFGNALQEVRQDISVGNFKSATQSLDEIDDEIQEIKTGGVLDLLQTTSNFQQVEETEDIVDTRRKILQTSIEEDNFREFYTQIYLFLECTISKVKAAVNQLSENPNSSELLQETIALLYGLSNTLTMQRLQLLIDLNCPNGANALSLFANDAQIRGYNLQPQELLELPTIPYIDNSIQNLPEIAPVVPTSSPEEPYYTYIPSATDPPPIDIPDALVLESASYITPTLTPTIDDFSPLVSPVVIVPNTSFEISEQPSLFTSEALPNPTSAPAPAPAPATTTTTGIDSPQPFVGFSISDTPSPKPFTTYGLTPIEFPAIQIPETLDLESILFTSPTNIPTATNNSIINSPPFQSATPQSLPPSPSNIPPPPPSPVFVSSPSIVPPPEIFSPQSFPPSSSNVPPPPPSPVFVSSPSIIPPQQIVPPQSFPPSPSNVPPPTPSPVFVSSPSIIPPQQIVPPQSFPPSSSNVPRPPPNSVLISEVSIVPSPQNISTSTSQNISISTYQNNYGYNYYDYSSTYYSGSQYP